MKKNITSGITFCLFLSLAACSNAEQDTKTENTTAEKAVTASTPTIADAQPAALSGKILETMNSGGYTYLKIDTGTSQPWIALPQSNVKVGDDVSCLPGMTMNNFSSKTLNRTFASLVFSPGIVGNQGDPHGGMMGAMGGGMGDDSFASAVKAEGGAPAMQQAPAGSGGSKSAAVPFSEISVEKAAGENAYSVEEIFAKTKDLNGKTVRIKGTVVKSSPMIMGRNWIHLQDGTGNPADNTHDLVVTTSEEIQKGSTITIEGVVAFQKDFGAGYKYVAIVEDAKSLK